MIAAVREKRRGVVVESVVIVEKSVVRSLGKEESMRNFLGGKGREGIDKLYGPPGACGGGGRGGGSRFGSWNFWLHIHAGAILPGLIPCGELLELLWHWC
jgi:hypothetical protein